METSIIKSLFRWFADCDVLEVDNDLNVDYLGEDPEQYSIEVVPCKTVLKQYIDGSAKCQYLLSLQAVKITVPMNQSIWQILNFMKDYKSGLPNRT